ISHLKLNEKLIRHMNRLRPNLLVSQSIGGTAMTGFRDQTKKRTAGIAIASSASVIGVLTPLLLAVPAVAETWPTRAVTMVAPGAAGSSVDVVARILVPSLSEALGRQVIVENIGGAGGMNAAAHVAKASPDGYQFVLGHSGTHAINQTLYKHPP